MFIHNSDSPKNRGDRAILVGNIQLARQLWPEAEIWALSQFRARDESWFGINFLPQSPYSVNPVHWVRMFLLARRSDVVLWGGGEILKDYTNKLGLVYWLIKITLLGVFNRNIIGAFQGIGPTASGFSRWAIRLTVNRTRYFLTRDEESRQKLIDWGVRIPVVASYDPAVVGVPAPFTPSLADRLHRAADVDQAFLRASAGFGLRKWFFYRQGGWLPHRFKPAFLRRQPQDDSEVNRYRERVARLADLVIERHDINVIFFPMHMDASEGDAAFAESVIERMVHGDRARILADDSFSSAEYAGIMGQLKFFVASRLHSAILATTARIPAIVLYYVDKGRLYFEQLHLERFSYPIEEILAEGAVERLADTIRDLVDDPEVPRQLDEGIRRMSEVLERDFSAAAGVVMRGMKRAS